MEHHPLHQKVVGSIPSRGVCGRQLISLSLSLCVALPKVNTHILGGGLKKKVKNS